MLCFVGIVIVSNSNVVNAADVLNWDILTRGGLTDRSLEFIKAYKMQIDSLLKSKNLSLLSPDELRSYERLQKALYDARRLLLLIERDPAVVQIMERNRTGSTLDLLKYIDLDKKVREEAKLAARKIKESRMLAVENVLKESQKLVKTTTEAVPVKSIGTGTLVRLGGAAVAVGEAVAEWIKICPGQLDKLEELERRLLDANIKLKNKKAGNILEAIIVSARRSSLKYEKEALQGQISDVKNFLNKYCKGFLGTTENF